MEEHKQIADWLEELKELRKEKDKFDRNVKFFNEINVKSHKEGYNKAIDDFLEKNQWEYLDGCGIKQSEKEFLINVSSQVAEQLKAGEVDDL